MATALKSLAGYFNGPHLTTADGRSEEQAAEAVGAAHHDKTGVVHDLAHLSLKDKGMIASALPALLSGEPMDDKKLLLEKGVTTLQGLSPNSGLGDSMADTFINMLWKDLPHPAVSVVGPASRYRRHDGGGNNPWMPEMGKAKSPYARNVPPAKPKGPNLPDAEAVYDALLKRDGPFRKHPTGLNRMFFCFATVVIHECFQTSRMDQTINETSSYVDLSTLYGNTEVEQKRVRTYKNGLIHPDSLASERIMMMPPPVTAVLILFSRNHNQIAESLLSVNESGTYQPWDQITKEEQKKKQDEDIFQIARNINVGFFATIVLKDYVAAILNTPRANSEWSLNLGKEIKKFGKRVDRGVGNVVSVEFAVLYHWHAALSAADDEWMKDVLWDGISKLKEQKSPEAEAVKDIEDIDAPLFIKITMEHAKNFPLDKAKDWEFGGIKRQADGRFKDSDIAEIIKCAIEEPAHAFGARGTPSTMKMVEILAQKQARDVFNVCTLNEFRRYLNLKPYDSFEEWAEDKSVAHAAELLYGHVENLELYPGLMAECTKPAGPGSGVCPGQTTGRGILDDAVALVRGDRFLSYDFNSNTLTNWGASLLSDNAPGAYGGMLPRLLFRAIPGAWTGTSAYALLPFYTPEAAREILINNGAHKNYDLSRPKSNMDIVSIQTHAGCKKVFEDRENFRVMYQPAIRQVTGGHEFMIGWDDEKRHNTRLNMLMDALMEEHFEKHVSEFFCTNVEKLIQKNSLKLSKGQRSIDIVRDVTNMTPILWLADRFAIPLKTKEHPQGLISAYDTFHAYLAMFMYQSFNIMPINEWKLRESATKSGQVLGGVFEANLKARSGIIETILSLIPRGGPFQASRHADRLYHKLNESRLPIGDLVADCIGMGAPVAGNLTQQASLLIDLYLSPGYEKYKKRIMALAHMPVEKSEDELVGFVMEGMRLAGVVPGVPRVATCDITITDGGRGPIHIKEGHTVLVATSKAAMDPTQYPEPEKINPHRPLEDYLLMGHGLHVCFGRRLVAPALAATLREVFKLKNVRRAPGRLGRFTIAKQEVAGVEMNHYLDSSAKESPIPSSLTIYYDVPTYNHEKE